MLYGLLNKPHPTLPGRECLDCVHLYKSPHPGGDLEGAYKTLGFNSESINSPTGLLINHLA